MYAVIETPYNLNATFNTSTKTVDSTIPLKFCSSIRRPVWRGSSDRKSPKRDVRVCIALKLNQKLDNNIPTTTHKTYNEVWKSLPSVFWCVFKASQYFQTPCWVVYLSAAGPRVSLYYVNGRLETWSRIWMKFDPSFEESTSKISLKFAWNLSKRLPTSPHAKRDDVRSFRSNYFFVENKVYFKSGAIFAADRAVRGNPRKPLTRNKRVYLKEGIRNPELDSGIRNKKTKMKIRRHENFNEG